MTDVIAVGDPVRLGSADAPLQFAESERRPHTWRGSRHLMLDGEEAFELSFWCGTCPFLFQRQYGANRTLAPTELSARLSEQLSGIDAGIVETAGSLLPEGEYLPLLTQLTPRLVLPGDEDDYFSAEQVRTWGIRNFWGLPEYPSTAYYRGSAPNAGPEARLFEFVVPMVPPTWNDRDQVAHYERQMAAGTIPTCLAVAILDVCQPATAHPDAPEPDLIHWGLAHFLLDGHHKAQAAAQGNHPVQLLTLLAIDHSLATREQVLGVPAILAGGQV